jgi:ubiquinone/menaquinone biosynthesis C-methylase UbiE
MVRAQVAVKCTSARVTTYLPAWITRGGLQVVRRHSGPSSSFLDIGTGTGQVALALAAKYPEAKVRPWVGECVTTMTDVPYLRLPRRTVAPRCCAVPYPTAQISAVDYSPLMIDSLRRKLAAAGPAAAGVTPHQLDATQLPREWAASFDGAFGNLCLMFIPEPVKGTLSAACLAWVCIGVGTCGHPRRCGGLLV